MLRRVQMVQYFLPPEPQGGAELEAVAIADWLRTRGVESEVIGVAPALQHPSIQGATPLRPVGWNSVFDAALSGRAEDYSGVRGVLQIVRYDGYLLALHRFLRSSSRPGDVVVFPFLSPVSAVGCRACEGLCPTVTEWAGEFELHEPFFRSRAVRPLGSYLRSWALRSCHFASHFEKGLDELDQLGIPKERQSFMPIGVDAAKFCPTRDRASARAKMRISSREFVVAYVARLRPEKGHRCALDALTHALQLGVPARLLIVGDGPLRESLGNAVAALALEEHVTFCGSVADVREYLWAADIAMLLSSTEGPSRAVAEAMSCGLPVFQ